MADSESVGRKTWSGGAPEPCEPTEGGNDRSDPARTQETDASTNGSGDLPGEVFERLEAMETLIEARIGRVLEAFENKLAYDRSKDVQVDRLHEELLQHRSDLVGQTVRPLVRDVIRLHDDIGKLVSALRENSPDETAPEKFLRLLEGLQQDVELMLEHNGVDCYRKETGGRFDPGRQRVLRTVPTGNRDIAGTVAQSVRPGFEHGGQVVERERVLVYRLEAPRAEHPAPASPPPAADSPDPAEDAGDGPEATVGGKDEEG